MSQELTEQAQIENEQQAPAEAKPIVLAIAQRGMTLIEIMVVMAIIALIGTVVAMNVGGAQDDADLMAARTLVRNVGNQVDLYRSIRREYPNSLDVLVEERRIPKSQTIDPWRQPLSYELTDLSFRVCSNGPDKQPGTQDDICSDDDE